MQPGQNLFRRHVTVAAAEVAIRVWIRKVEASALTCYNAFIKTLRRYWTFINVTAVDQVTRKSQSIRITGSTRLPETDKQRMIKDAESYAEQDRKRREEVEKLNTADALCYQAEKTLVDFGDKLSTELRSKIEMALRETREAYTKHDATLATERADKLQRVLQEVGKAFYPQVG